jgi:S-adenosylmethionine hydrolase
MNYLNYFGSCQKQIDDIQNIECELLVRKIVSLGLLADLLKENGIFLYLSTIDRYGGINLNIEKKDCEELYSFNELSFLLVYPEKYGLETTFFDKYVTLIHFAMEMDEKLKNEDVRELKIQERINIDTSDDKWLKIIFRVLRNETLYHLFMTKILGAELEVNSKKHKALKV